MGTAMPGWTSQATTGVAFSPFSSRAASLHGAGGMVLSMPWMETLKERTWLGASTASPTHFGAETHTCEQCLWTPMLCSLWGPVAVRSPPGLALELEEGWLLPHHPWLMLPWTLLGQVLWCFTYDRFLSPVGCLSLTGTSCPP